MLALISFIRRSDENGGDEGNGDDDNEGNGVYMADSGPGFTLPANIGDLEPAFNELILQSINLTGQ